MNATTPSDVLPDTAEPAAVAPGARLISGICLCASSAVLGVACWLRPAAEGLGTHQRLGLPACGLMQICGIPCPSCGMTTAFAYAVRGELVHSFLTQPMGALMAVATAAIAIVSAYGLATGVSLAPLTDHLLRPRLVLMFMFLFVAAWVFKIGVTCGFIG